MRKKIESTASDYAFHNLFNFQVRITNSLYGGLKVDYLNLNNLETLLRRAITENKPVSHLLDVSSYDLPVIEKSLIQLLQEMKKNSCLEDLNIDYITRTIQDRLTEIINYTLIEDHEAFETTFLNEGLSLELLFMIGGFLVQPSLRVLGVSSSKQLLDAWGQTQCPICGRIPSVVVKPEDVAWLFKCSYCGTQYKIDIFSCPHCEAQGSDNKIFHIIGENKEYEIAACSECNRYYKIINTSRLSERMPEGLEDIYTSFLDEMAADFGYLRIDEKEKCDDERI